MRLPKPVFAFMAVLLAIASALILDIFFTFLFSPVQAWYFERFVQPLDPHPRMLALRWLSSVISPLVAAALGGALAALFYRDRSWGFATFIGGAFGTLQMVSRTLTADLKFVIFALAMAMVSFFGCHLVQRKLSGPEPPFIR